MPEEYDHNGFERSDEMKKTIYYETMQDDVVEASDQQATVPENYRWIRSSKFYDFNHKLLYKLFYGWAYVFIKYGLHTTIVNKEILQKEKRGYFLYINHTQTVGDPFLPSQIVVDKETYIVASPSNLSIPILGKILPILGALPLPTGAEQMKRFRQAIATRIQEKQCVVIFPEAHVWPYYTDIRPFENAAFQFPIDTQAPVYCATVTYQKDRHHHPKRTVYVHGPFMADPTLQRVKKRKKLANEVYEQMKKDARHNTFQFVQYIQRKENL